MTTIKCDLCKKEFKVDANSDSCDFTAHDCSAMPTEIRYPDYGPIILIRDNETLDEFFDACYPDTDV